MKSLTRILLCLIFLSGTSCNNGNTSSDPAMGSSAQEMTTTEDSTQSLGAIQYASGFELSDQDSYQILKIKAPWPGSDRTYNYLLLQHGQKIPEGVEHHPIIRVPVKRIVVTSTTHIAALEILESEDALIGFPELDHISSKRTRSRITAGEIQDVGKNEALNTEILLDLQPELVVGFSIDGSNRPFTNLEKSGIQVVFNADWMEQTPLGKAEWIKFFGALFGKSEEANVFFNQVADDYHEALHIAKQASTRPSVLSGSLFQDQWFLPAGDSWHAKFLRDANTNYLYADSPGIGSLTLSLEAVLAKAQDAEFWIGPAQFQTYSQLENASRHYTRFKAFKERKIYTYSSVRGETGGLLFFELAPSRPDLVLKDLISIFHPDLLPGYEAHFYKPLLE